MAEEYFLKPLTSAELDVVLGWRNSDRIRAVSFRKELITPSEHRTWFESLQQSKQSKSFVFFRGPKPLGVVNFTHIDAAAKSCEWGFYIGEPSAKPGTGTLMALLALDLAFKDLNIDMIRGRVLGSNPSSRQFHEKLGFVEESGDSENVHTFVLKKEQWLHHRNIHV